ncbi:hypothetical protein GGR57DRAFT_484677 [Xylariaceae sp. FL1272]|nr:hypothetical protein GGR57DRAFT_484677 [Xylariaceae sp. FL1272]
MPPKRKAPPISNAEAKANAESRKKALADKDSELAEKVKKCLANLRLERWSKVSGSRNAARGYFETIDKDEKKAYSFYTLCKPLHHLTPEEDPDYHSDADDSEEDYDSEGDIIDDDDDEADKEGRVGSKCKKENCVCFLPANQNPEHPWIMSFGGFLKFRTQVTMIQLRDPDLFSMYTFNDHANMGVLEVLENLLLDFEMADGSNAMIGWPERWSICEATVQLLMSDVTDVLHMYSDGERLENMMQLIGRQFLYMLAQLDSNGLLSDSSPILSLPITMASYMRLANIQREGNLLHDSTKRRSYGQRKSLQPNFYDDAILSYANQRGIMLGGFKNIDDMCAECVPEVKLPDRDKRDPWSYKQSRNEYKTRYSMLSDKATIGGDGLDLTSWSSAERKKNAFDKKDPLGKKELDALKQGMVMTMG